jgi:hypothetical protein
MGSIAGFAEASGFAVAAASDFGKSAAGAVCGQATGDEVRAKLSATAWNNLDKEWPRAGDGPNDVCIVRGFAKGVEAWEAVILRRNSANGNPPPLDRGLSEGGTGGGGERVVRHERSLAACSWQTLPAAATLR